jgi:hypothetical protein
MRDERWRMVEALEGRDAAQAVREMRAYHAKAMSVIGKQQATQTDQASSAALDRVLQSMMKQSREQPTPTQRQQRAPRAGPPGQEHVQTAPKKQRRARRQ